MADHETRIDSLETLLAPGGPVLSALAAFAAAIEDLDRRVDTLEFYNPPSPPPGSAMARDIQVSKERIEAVKRAMAALQEYLESRKPSKAGAVPQRSPSPVSGREATAQKPRQGSGGGG